MALFKLKVCVKVIEFNMWKTVRRPPCTYCPLNFSGLS